MILTPRDGVSGSLYPYKYNEPLTPSRGVIFCAFFPVENKYNLSSYSWI